MLVVVRIEQHSPQVQHAATEPARQRQESRQVQFLRAEADLRSAVAPGDGRYDRQVLCGRECDDRGGEFREIVHGGTVASWTDIPAPRRLVRRPYGGTRDGRPRSGTSQLSLEALHALACLRLRAPTASRRAPSAAARLRAGKAASFPVTARLGCRAFAT
jgi:hypothetical protein